MRDRADLEPIETASQDELQSLQLQRLKATLQHAYANVPHYRQRFDEKGVHPDDLTSLSDLAKFPFTGKDDLRANYPFGMFAVRASLRWSDTRKKILIPGPDWSRGRFVPPVVVLAISCTSLMDTACSLAVWARTTVPRNSVAQ